KSLASRPVHGRRGLLHRHGGRGRPHPGVRRPRAGRGRQGTGDNGAAGAVPGLGARNGRAVSRMADSGRRLIRSAAVVPGDGPPEGPIPPTEPPPPSPPEPAPPGPPGPVPPEPVPPQPGPGPEPQPP